MLDRPICRAMLALSVVACYGAGTLEVRGATDVENADQAANQNKERPRDHPFLITTRDAFPELIKRAEREPWKTMAADARKTVDAGPEAGRAVSLQRYLGALAVVYILEEKHRAEHALAVHEAITEKLGGVFHGEKWEGTVPPLGAAFVAILALDIVHDDLSADQLGAAEAEIERLIRPFGYTGPWPGGRQGTLGTWDVYTGKRTEPDDAYYDNIMRQMTDDGVTTVAAGYAFSRLGSDWSRPQKSAYADVLEFTGIDRRYYNNPRLHRFYRWLLGHSVSPAKHYHMFGDVGPYWRHPVAAGLWRVGRFDSRAAGYAAWLFGERQPPGHILSYVLMTEPLPDPIVPGSKLFPKGGAVFREPEDRAESLGAALYSIDGEPDWHTHQETNAVAFSAYGARLLVNGGWLGPPTWPADRNNTLTIDGREHARKTGGGLQEGLVVDGLDYAAGLSGAALGRARHVRSLVLVHGRPEAPGYAVVLDEFESGGTADVRVHTYFHPATEREPETVSRWLRYRAVIDHHAEVEGVRLDVVYSPAPLDVARAELPSGELGRDPKAGRHYRLEAIHDTDKAGAANTITLLYPLAPDQPPPRIERIEPDASAEASDSPWSTPPLAIHHGPEMVDLWAIGGSLKPGRLEGARLQGDAAMVRLADGMAVMYLLRRGVLVRAGGVGVESGRPISIAMVGDRGRLSGGPARVRFHRPGVRAVRLDGDSIEPVDQGEGWIEVEAPGGDLSVELIAGR